MAQIGIILNMEDTVDGPVMIQGDDSGIFDDITVNSAELKFLESLGWKYKIMTDDNGVIEYVGYCLHQDGWMPDLFRRLVKSQMKLHTTKEKFDESIIGLQDTMSVVQTNDELERGIASLLYFYQNHTELIVNEAELRQMFAWLACLRTSDWNKCHTRIMDSYVIQ